MSGDEQWHVSVDERMIVNVDTLESIPLDRYNANVHGEVTHAYSGARRFVRDEGGLFIEAMLVTRPGHPLRIVESRATVSRKDLKPKRY